MRTRLSTVFFFTITQSWQCWHYCQLCIPIYLQLSSITTDLCKCGIRNQGVNEDYISMIKTQLRKLILNGTAKTKLVMLAVLYCKDFVKSSVFCSQVPLVALAQDIC